MPESLNTPLPAAHCAYRRAPTGAVVVVLLLLHLYA